MNHKTPWTLLLTLAAVASLAAVGCARDADVERPVSPVGTTGSLEQPAEPEPFEEIATDPFEEDVASCPAFYDFDQPWSDGAGPLRVEFTVPSGFVPAAPGVDRSEVIASRLEHSVSSDGHTQTVAIEVVQSRDGLSAQQVEEELAFHSSDELAYNIPMARVRYGDDTLQVYRSDKRDGRAYSLAVPGEAGDADLYLTTLYVTSTEPACVAEMEILADQILATLRPSPATPLVSQD